MDIIFIQKFFGKFGKIALTQRFFIFIVPRTQYLLFHYLHKLWAHGHISTKSRSTACKSRTYKRNQGILMYQIDQKIDSFLLFYNGQTSFYTLFHKNLTPDRMRYDKCLLGILELGLDS